MTQVETPCYEQRSDAGRLPTPLRLLVLEAPSPARQSLVALAKVLGVEDITVVECLDDAYAALENAGFDAFVYDCDEQGAPIDGLIGQVRGGGVCPANARVTIIGKAAPGAEGPSGDASGPDVILAKPLRFDRVFGALAQAASRRADRSSAAA